MENPLELLGWDARWAQSFAPHAMEGFAPGRIAREDRDQYLVLTAAGETTARMSGRLRRDAQAGDLRPAVGDWVAVRLPPAAGTALIQAVMERRSRFVRKAVRGGGPAYGEGRTEEQVMAANIDTAFLVSGLNEDFNPRRIERYLAATWDGGARPVILLNKSDLCPQAAARRAEVSALAPGVAVHALSAATAEGLEALEPYLHPGRTVVFLGSSGVGKSSLINRLLDSARQEVLPVREYDGRGRHATTARELLRLPRGAMLIDTPGLRELRLWDEGDGLQRAFDDIDEFATRCRFRDCRHDGEPGCAVRQAIDDGALDPLRLVNYLKLRREQDVLAVRRSQRARMTFGPGGKRLPRRG